MTRTTFAQALAATLLVGTLATAFHAAPASVDAAKKPRPTATATATMVPTATPTATNTPLPTATPSPVPTDTPVPFTVVAWVSPSSMPYDYYPTLYGQTLPGASCSAHVTYANGHVPTSFNGYTQTVPASGLVGWTWHEQSTSTGGTGTVTCTYQGQTKFASGNFSIY